MKKSTERVLIFGGLVFLSAVIYYLHFLTFGDAHHIFIYLLGDLAFLPLEILFVSLIFHKLLTDREKKKTFRKLNMIIGAFFSEIGNQLLILLIKSDIDIAKLQKDVLFNGSWGKSNFKCACLAIGRWKGTLVVSDLEEIKQLLLSNRDFLLKIIENPTLLEHELFSELMMAIFHLEEELASRVNVNQLSQADKEHIELDVVRVYKILLRQWILYIQHLKREYPYLYSFAIRTNPFDKEAKVEIS